MPSPSLRASRACKALVSVAAGWVLVGPAGCDKKIAVDRFPPGALQVHYADASELTDCLVACATMCGNYAFGDHRLDQADLRKDIQSEGLDVGLAADVKTVLAAHGLTLMPLHGKLSDDPQTGLGWWICERGYPVICVINKYGGKADYNHAVVVIGFDTPRSAETAEKVFLLDPASPKKLHRWDRSLFEHFWGSGGNGMMAVYVTPIGVAGRS